MVDVCNVCVSPTKLSNSPDTMVIIPIHQVELLRYRCESDAKAVGIVMEMLSLVKKIVFCVYVELYTCLGMLKKTVEVPF